VGLDMSDADGPPPRLMMYAKLVEALKRYKKEIESHGKDTFEV
jgi:hypothetical protein